MCTALGLLSITVKREAKNIHRFENNRRKCQLATPVDLILIRLVEVLLYRNK